MNLIKKFMKIMNLIDINTNLIIIKIVNFSKNLLIKILKKIYG